MFYTEGRAKQGRRIHARGLMSAVDCGQSGLACDVCVNMEGALLAAVAMSCAEDWNKHDFE